MDTLKRIVGLETWSLLSCSGYQRLLLERGLHICEQQDELIIARDATITFAGPAHDRVLAYNASRQSIRRLSRVCRGLALPYWRSQAAMSLLHNIVIRSYREFMPPGQLAMRTCDLQSQDLFIDIGCFRGYLALKAASIVGSQGRVMAIDPNPASIQLLRTQLDLNPRLAVDAVLAAAVAESCPDAAVQIQDAGDGSTRNSLINDHLKAQTQTRSVDAVRISDLLNQCPAGWLQGRRIVASITTNGTELDLASDLLAQSPVSVTCTIPSLYTVPLLRSRLPGLMAAFPGLVVNHAFPWLQLRLEK